MHRNSTVLFRIKDIYNNIVMPSVFTLVFCIFSHNLLFVLLLFFFFFLLMMLTAFTCFKVFKSHQHAASVLEVVPFFFPQ